MAKVERNFREEAKSIDRFGNCTGTEIPYVVFEAADEDDALRAVLETAPQSCQNVPLECIEIERRENESTFKVRARYARKSASGNDALPRSGTVSFDCGGGIRHMTHSISQRRAFGRKDAGGAIGWNGKSGSEMVIAGVDVPTAQLRENYTRYMPLAAITTAYKRNVASLVGKVNSGRFKGWEPGEVMFLGMSYSAPNNASSMVTVSFSFAIQPNESKVSVGGRTLSKKGYEYVWALSESSVVDGVPKSTVEAIYVDQVCEYASFHLLGL